MMNTPTVETRLAQPCVVTRDAWLARRLELLAREKELTHLRDQVARERRALPWVRLDKAYTFDTPDGPRTLADLFDGRRQLMVQHFMFAPGWERGCKSCSFMADHIAGALPHLAQRDLGVLVVARASLPEIERFRRRMGWQFRWVSSQHSDFNHDFAVSFTPADRVDGKVWYNYGRVAFPQEEAPGISMFYKDDAGEVFHTWSTYGRGVEAMMGTYDLLDLAPKGRDEDGLGSPMEWIRHHDRYEPGTGSASAGDSCCASRA
jgi:predicted dithiol-disulfide oxidoreductase (DUF899 family)